MPGASLLALPSGGFRIWEHRIFPESTRPVDNSRITLLAARFLMTDKFIGWGLLKGGPFRFPRGRGCATRRLLRCGQVVHNCSARTNERGFGPALYCWCL